MTLLAHFIIRYRIPILVATLLLTIGLGLLLPRLHADDDMMKFLPQNDPDIQLFTRVNKRFGGLDVAIIGLESDSMFTHHNIATIRQLTGKVAQIDGVYDILSFTEIPNPQPSGDGLRVTPLVMDKIPSTKEELEELKKTVLNNRNAVGNLISRNGKAAMVLCFLGGNRPPIHIAADIQRVATSIWQHDPIYFAGSPFIRLYIAGGTSQDMVRLTPLVAIVILVVTLIIFRRPVGVLLAVGVVAVAIIWLAGLSIAMGHDQFTIIASSLPTILLAIGGAYGIHILAGYFNGESQTVSGRIEEMMRTMGPPVIASGATTAVGFLSFLVMDIAPLRTFGIQAAVGVTITVVLALTVIPAILSFQKHPPRGLTNLLPVKPLGAIARFSSIHRNKVLLISLALALLSGMGIGRIAPDATMESFFSKGSDPDRANQFLKRHFGGASYLQVYLEGDIRSPFVLLQLQKIVEYTRSLDTVEQVSAITDSLVMMSEAMGGRADIPLTNRRAGSLYPFLEGTAAIDQMISKEKDASLVQIRLKDVSAEKVKQTVDSIRLFIQREVPRAVQAVQVGPFPIPNDAAKEYSTPQQVDGSGRVVKAAYETPIDASISSIQRASCIMEMQQDVAKRLVRLTKIHQHHLAPADAPKKLAQLFSRHGQSDTLAAGPDVAEATRRVIEEHIVVDYAFLEAEAQEDTGAESADPATEEWNHRAERVFQRMISEATRFINVDEMRHILKDALPYSAERDPEGLELTAESMALSFSQERSVLKSQRMLPEALQILGIPRPSAELRDALQWAMTDLDLPVYGFAGNGEGAAPVSATVTGSPVINIALCQSTISNQLKSLGVAIVALLVVLGILFRSFIIAVKGLVPAILMLALAVGVMGAFTIPIDMSTSMIAAIALGIGVDYAIHFLWNRKIRQETLEQTTQIVGPSVASNAIQVAAGFAVLCISSMIPMQRFGLLVALTMLLAMIATFALLPALRAEGKQSPPIKPSDR